MAKHFDVIVIGVGAMGSSACFHLARRGVRVLGLERFGIPNALGSSHGLSRMIRLAYYEDPDYVPLLRRAYELWDELEQASGQKLLHITGGVYAGPRGGEMVRRCVESAVAHALPHEPLARDEVARRWGVFELPDDFHAIHEPRAGFLVPERVVATQAEMALRAGAQLLGHEPVVEWSTSPSGASVRTPVGEYHAEKLIFCGGPWSGKLLNDLGVKLTVTRQVMGWVWPPADVLDELRLGRLPVWGIEADGGLFYGFPMTPGEGVGFKSALHAPGQVTDPDGVAREPMSGDEEQFRGPLRRFLPRCDGSVTSMRVCLYTNSPDSDFIIDRHPLHERVTIACGFSGHGFKFASVVGEVLADLTTESGTRHPVGFLGLDRFGGSDIPV